MRMIVRPVKDSLFRIALCMGAAPLYLGKREAWVFIAPHRGITKSSLLRICPNATTMIIAGAASLIRPQKFVSDTFSGCSANILFSRASFLTGENAIFFPLPSGLSGCVTTANISCPSLIRDLKDGMANLGVPINMILGLFGNLSSVIVFMLSFVLNNILINEYSI